MKFATDNSLTALLNEAQATALAKMDGAPLTVTTLEQLAAHIKSALLTQVALGHWRELNVIDPDDLVDLEITMVPGNQLVGEPPVKALYDFSKTSRPDICVETVRAS